MLGSQDKRFLLKAFKYSLPKFTNTSILLLLPIFFGKESWYNEGLNLLLGLELGMLGIHPLIIWAYKKYGSVNAYLFVFSVLISFISSNLSTTVFTLFEIITLSISITFIKYIGSYAQYNSKYLLATIYGFLLPTIIIFCVAYDPLFFVISIFISLLILLSLKNIKYDFDPSKLIDSTKFLLNVTPQMIFSWLFRGGIILLLINFHLLEDNISDTYQIIVRSITVVTMPAIILNQINLKQKSNLTKFNDYWKILKRELILIASASTILTLFIIVLANRYYPELDYLIVYSGGIIAILSALNLPIASVFNQNKSYQSFVVYSVGSITLFSFLIAQVLNLRSIILSVLLSTIIVLVLFGLMLKKKMR